MPERVSPTDAAYSDVARFLETAECLPHIELDSFEFRWRDWLKAKYGTPAACSAAHGRSYASFETIPLKLDEYDAWLMLQHRGAIVREFLVRNYLHVFDFLFRHGSALKVTFLYVALNVLLHLLINPLAAYALSRHRMRFGHWILLICVLTMAFPAEVGSIPRFLLIRELGLLNTIWALVLPGAAHGFSIFMLKSFFDGLPQELYEAAAIESASELWMFRNVTLALTKPILAVTAFGAFTSAYGAFLFALVIAPDERMWTISVWLYQFQQGASDPARFASLVVASVPVLVAFCVMQRFILRGIVLPVER
jgi:multiple sugar transport system permease protein